MALSKITPNSFSSFSTANTNFDNGTLFIDPVNNRVGINTTTGQATFTVQGYGADGLQLLTDPNNPGVSSRIFLTNSTASGALYYQNTTGWVFNTGSTLMATSGTPRMYISTEGYVRKPYHPSFNAGLSSNPTVAGYITHDLDSGSAYGRHNIGGHYSTSTGKFTAPISGVYAFHYVQNSYQFSGGHYITIRRNGGDMVGLDYSGTPSFSGWWGRTVSCVVQLSQGDYIQPYVYGSATYTGETITWGMFAGHLIG